MILLKILCKIVALPIVLVISAIVALIDVISNLGGLLLGIINLSVIVVAVGMILIEGDWATFKQTCFFLLIENIAIAFVGICINAIRSTRDKLAGFIFS